MVTLEFSATLRPACKLRLPVPADALIALPLFPSKERKRGYNQAAVLCEGFSNATGIPFLPNAVARRVYTDTQTHKNRIERWQNMEGKFVLAFFSIIWLSLLVNVNGINRIACAVWR